MRTRARAYHLASFVAKMSKRAIPQPSAALALALARRAAKIQTPSILSSLSYEQKKEPSIARMERTDV